MEITQLSLSKQLCAKPVSQDLLARYPLKPGWARFGGTLAARGGIRPGKVFRMELEDPVRKRKLAHEYRIEALPVEG